MLRNIFRPRNCNTDCKFGLELMPGDGFAGFRWRTPEKEIRRRHGAPVFESGTSSNAEIAYSLKGGFGNKEVIRWFHFQSHELVKGYYLASSVFPHEYSECIKYIVYRLSNMYGDFISPVESNHDVSAVWWAGGDTQIRLLADLVTPQNEWSRIEIALQQISALGKPQQQSELFLMPNQCDAEKYARTVLSRECLPKPSGFEGCDWGSTKESIIQSVGDPTSIDPWPGRPESTVISYDTRSEGVRYFRNFILKHGVLYKGSYLFLRLSENFGWCLINELKLGLAGIFGDRVVHKRQDDPNHPTGVWSGFVWETTDVRVFLQLKSPTSKYPTYAAQLDVCSLQLLRRPV